MVLLRGHLLKIVDSATFQNAVIALIVVNAFILGLQAWPPADAAWGQVLNVVDEIILWVFVAELALRIVAVGPRFFRDPWSLFDLAVVLVSLSAVTGGMSALRALRVLRILRLISAMPKLRLVVGALLESIPGIASVGFVLLLILYVSSILATNLYGATTPEYFGDLFTSMYSLFVIMTLEGWTTIADAVMENHPRAWVFFIVFILIATFTMLNLFIGIVVSVLESESEMDNKELLNENKALKAQMERLEQQMAALSQRIDDVRGALGDPSQPRK